MDQFGEDQHDVVLSFENWSKLKFKTSRIVKQTRKVNNIMIVICGKIELKEGLNVNIVLDTQKGGWCVDVYENHTLIEHHQVARREEANIQFAIVIERLTKGYYAKSN